MTQLRITSLLLVLLATSCHTSWAQDNVGTGSQIQQAREKFETENKAILSEIAKDIDTKEEAERKRAKPDLERIKHLKADREQLDQLGEIPDWTSSKLKSRMKKNVQTLMTALSAAKSESLRNKDDKAAEELDREIEQLKTNSKLVSIKSPSPAKPATVPAPNTTKVSGTPGPKAGIKAKVWPRNAPEFAKAPFTPEQARKHQETWARYLKVDVEITNKLGMKFRLIPPGEFLMGSTPAQIEEVLKICGDDAGLRAGFASEAPQHAVTLTRPVYLSVHEVTQAQYQKVMGSNPAHYSKTGRNKNDVVDVDTNDLPVETTSWLDAAEFCARLSVAEKLRPHYNRVGDKVEYFDGNGYRMPTEAEWEFACRAGTTSKFWNGDKDEDVRSQGIGWHSGGRPQAVGTLKANPFGLYDTVGNVREWMDDYWDANWYDRFQNTMAIDPRCPGLANSEHVVRGGCYGDPPFVLRSSARMHRFRTDRGPDVGFRVVLTVNATR